MGTAEKKSVGRTLVPRKRESGWGAENFLRGSMGGTDGRDVGGADVSAGRGDEEQFSSTDDRARV